MKKLTFILLASLFASTANSQWLGNDDCGTAFPLTVGAPCTSGNNFIATLPGDFTMSCGFGGDPTQAAVWFSFVCPPSGAVTISTDNPGTTFDTQINLLGAAAGDATICPGVGFMFEYGCDEDGGTGLTSTMTVGGLVPGQTYWIQIDGYLGATGDYCISVTEVPCNADVGTFTISATGGSTTVVGSDIYVCEDGASCFSIISNNDYVLPLGFASTESTFPFGPCVTSPELMYAIYINLPPTTGNPDTDPNWAASGSLFWTGQDFLDCNPSAFPPTITPGDVVYLVPVTVDDGDDDGTCGGLQIDGNLDGCFDVGTTMTVYYLNDITFSTVIDNCAGTVDITVNGGSPEMTGGNYTITNTGAGTLGGTPISDGGTVTISGLGPGDAWSIGVVDPLGCTEPFGGVFVGDPVLPTITCPADITVSNDPGSCDAAVVVPIPIFGDNCPSPTITNDYNGTGDASDTYPVGTTTVTWTVTDGNGNTATCTMDITVNDTENPTITCPADITVSNDAGSCDAAVVVPLPVLADNCPGVSATNDFNGTGNASGTYPVGTTTVTWTVTDGAGNTATCTHDVTVNDTENPTITCPADITVSNDAGSCDAAVTVPLPVIADNCPGASATNDFTGTGDASGTYPVGTTTVTWTVTDGAGNTATCTHDVTVNDTENPTITCPADITVSNDAGSCDAAVVVPAPIFADNCPGSSVVNDFNGTADASGTYPVGTTTVTWTVTDAAGNTTICMHDVTVNDTEAPTITCPGDQTVSNDPGACTAAVTIPVPVISDNCPGASATNDFNGTGDASGTYPLGTTVVTWTVTDAAGNTTTCTHNITVNETELPTITCPADITVSNDPGVCNALVAVPIPVFADNCPGASVTNDYNGTGDATDTYPVGTTTVTWTVTDAAGNTATCTMDITVNDTENPTITCPADVTVGNDPGSCDATGVALGAPVTADNCGVSGTSNDAPATYPLGTTVVTWTVTDIYGSTATCTQNVTVNDTEAPTITCPGDQTVSNDPGACDAVVTIPVPVISDNCPGATATNDFTGTGDASGTYPLGTTVVTWTVTDAAGNTTTCTHNITVNETELPTITCPGDITVSNDAGSCDAAVVVPIPVFGDNCPGATVTNDFNGTGDASDTYPVGTTTVTWTVTDAAGNTATCTMDITVNDTENPTITCPADITVGNDAGSCDAAVAVPLPVLGDNCPGATATNDFNGTADASDTYPLGTTTVTWTVTDAAGNTATCTMDITVNDTENPTITCPTDITIANDPGVCNAFVTVPAPTFADNCPGSSVTNDFNGTSDASDTYPVGTTTVTWTVTDAAGNTTTCTMDITVNDTEAPTITCPADITTGPDVGSCNATAVALGAAITADNCGVASVTNDAPAVFISGTTTVTWTVTDLSGNTTTCTQDVTVTDNLDPIALCMDITVNLDPTGNVTILATDIDGGSSDNCLLASLTIDISAFDCSNIGPNTVTLTATDGNGNTDFCTATVTVVDPNVATIDAGPDASICAGQTHTLAGILGGTATTGVWSTSGDGTFSLNTDPNAIYTPGAADITAGTVTLTWTSDPAPCAIVTDDMILTITAGPSFTVAGTDPTTCNGTDGSIVLSGLLASTSYDISYDDGSGPITITVTTDAAGNYTITGLGAGTYTGFAAMESGCTGFASTTVTLVDPPIPAPPAAGTDATYCEDDPMVDLTATAGSGGVLNWYSDAGLTTNIGTGGTLTPSTQSGITLYYVNETANGCVGAASTVTIEIEFCLVDITIPTGFTPDGDGVNDTWELVNLDAIYPNSTVRVFNRWGNEVFNSQGYPTEWDGSHKGQNLPTGSYFFIIQYGVDGKADDTGSVSIIR